MCDDDIRHRRALRMGHEPKTAPHVRARVRGSNLDASRNKINTQDMPTVRLFVPDDLTSDAPLLLLGWACVPAPDELLIVVAGAARARPDERAEVRNGRVPALSIVGSLVASNEAAHDVKRKSRAMDGDPGSVLQGRVQVVLQQSSSRSSDALSVTSLSVGADEWLQRCDAVLHIYTYHRPRPQVLQYLSLHHHPPTPQGALGDADLLWTGQNATAATRVVPSAAQLALEQSIQSDPARQGELAPSSLRTGSSMRIALDLMNEAAASIQNAQGMRPSPISSIAASVPFPAQLRPAFRTASRVLNAALSVVVYMLSCVRDVLDYRIQLPGKPRSKRGLTDLFSTAEQLSTRLDQLLTWPTVSRQLRTLRITRAAPTYAISAHYMSVWNGIWLVINDLILGHAAGSLLRAHKDELAAILSAQLHSRTVADVVALLHWLSAWPAGLKLNTQLARFFAAACAGGAGVWADVVLAPGSGGLGLGTAPVLARIVDTIGRAGQLGGLTLILALCADAVSLGTLHIHGGYLLARGVYAAFLAGIDVLFQVFRGQKRNALQGGRVDVAEYGLDERLLGTILFTILVFLFPTVLVYYLPFALAEWARVGVRAGVLEVGLALLNHLPLFGLMLRLKDPARVSAGVELVPEEAAPHEEPKDGAVRTARFRLRTVPASLGQLFHGQAEHFSLTRQMPALLVRVVTGRKIEVDYAGSRRRRAPRA